MALDENRGLKMFAKTIRVGEVVYTRDDGDEKNLSGLNPKAIYTNPEGARFILKVEKKRTVHNIYDPSTSKMSDPDRKAFFDTSPALSAKQTLHVAQLRDGATAMSVIASDIAKKLCPNMAIPANVLVRLEDGTPAVLSRFLCFENGESAKLVEFLSEKSVIKEKEAKVQAETGLSMTPKDWPKQISVSELELTEKEAFILGQIYYAGLLMGHWDLFNNINLSNSGYVIDENGALIPSIVDWGNCLGVGFGGVSQDASSFNNPELDPKVSEDNLITGFKGSVPFDSIVYPQLPRQLAAGLFDLDPSNPDKINQAVLSGFLAQHKETSELRSKIEAVVTQAIEHTLAQNRSFESALPQELMVTGKGTYTKDENNKLKREEQPDKPELIDILEGRCDSLDDIVSQLKKGISMKKISEGKLREIEESQTDYPSLGSK